MTSNPTSLKELLHWIWGKTSRAEEWEKTFPLFTNSLDWKGGTCASLNVIRTALILHTQHGQWSEITKTVGQRHLEHPMFFMADIQYIKAAKLELKLTWGKWLWPGGLSGSGLTGMERIKLGKLWSSEDFFPQWTNYLRFFSYIHLPR